MKYTIKYVISDLATEIIRIFCAVVGLVSFWLTAMLSDSLIVGAFLGSYVAIYSFGLLTAAYIKMTRQYNSYGEWVAGGEGKPDKIDPVRRRENRQAIWSALFLIILFGSVYLFSR